MTASAWKHWNARRGWNAETAAHLLRRAGFGASPDELERAVEVGFETTLAELFEPRGHDERLMRGIAPLVTTGEIAHLQAWWMALIVGGGAPLTERVSLVWHNHFATSYAKVQDVRLMYAQNNLFREAGLGDFRALLHRVARDPAMLVWLDGNSNKAGHPNQNFAREVLELFALGIGNYTEADVLESARALTGWGTAGGAFIDRAADHDTGEKTVFGRTENFDGDSLLDWILAQPACARHVAKRLWNEFLGTPIDEEALDALARELVIHEWRVGDTLEVLLSSERFFAESARRARIAGPVEWIAASERALGVSLPPAETARAAGRMGQSLFEPPNVKGWDGGRTWINAGTWLARHEFAYRMLDAAPAEHDGQTNDPTARAIATLLPGWSDADYEERVRTALNGARGEDARREALAIVLTSPEYQTF